MVTFKMDTAIKVAEHYKFLIGQSLDPVENITTVKYIVIAPFLTDGLQDFLIHFRREEDNALALSRSRHDKNKLLIYLLTADDSTANNFHAELDNILTIRGIEKIYNADGSLKAQ